MGHLLRSFGLSRALAKRFAVTFVNGGRVPDGIPTPAGIDRVDLAPIGMDEDTNLVSREAGTSVEAAMASRRATLLATVERIRPTAIVVELFPFGRKKFADEILGMLAAAQHGPEGAPLAVCSLRDILVSGRRDQARHDDRAAQTVNDWFDAVLVHSDPRFARLEDTFRPAVAMTRPILHTGFVRGHGAGSGRAFPRARQVIVSAGGGLVGGPLFRAAVAAHRLSWSRLRLPMRIIAGPFLPDDQYASLATEVAALEGLTLERSVPDLSAELARATCSVSQCGYNTAMDLLGSGVSALVVPYATNRETEQHDRAARLERLGAVQTLPAATLDGPRLAAAIERLADFRPAPNGLDLEGAEKSALLIEQLARAKAERLAATGAATSVVAA